MEKNNVDILMATYNGEKYISEQIESIIRQNYQNWRLIIRDDNSKDKTKDIILKYCDKDKRIIFLQDKKGNLGYKKNFEELLKFSKAEYIFFCDQDDIWKENKIEKCLIYLSKYTVVHHDAEVIFQNTDKRLKLRISDEKNTFKKFIFPDFLGCCMGFKRELLKTVLPIPDKYPGHDSWICLQAEILRNIKYLNEELILYRRHDTNTSFNCEKSKNSFIKKIKYRYYYLVYPLFRVLKFKLKKKSKDKIIIDCMHTKEIFISLILYYINNDIILFLRESPYVEKYIINNIKKEVNVDRTIFYKYDNTNLVKKITSRLKEWLKVLKIILFYRDVDEMIFFREGNILFNILKRYKKITLYEHGMINYQKISEMFHGKEINKLQKFILNCFGETIGTYGRDKKVKEIYLTTPEKAPLDIIKKVKKLNIAEKWKMLKKEDKNKIIRIFGISNLELKDYNKKIILLTQPLSEQGFITEKEKIDIYKKILNKYKNEEVVIKVHPREKTDYKKFFNCKVLNKDFPIEVLNFEGIRFKKAITLYSTAIDTFDYDLEKERLGTGVSETLKKVRGDL